MIAPSSQLKVRVPFEMQAFLAQLADERRCSMNSLFNKALSQFQAFVLEEKAWEHHESIVRDILRKARLPAETIVARSIGRRRNDGETVTSIYVTRPGEGKVFLATVDRMGNVSDIPLRD